MYPNWWATSTESWKLGFLARKVKDSKVTLFAVYTQYEPTHKYEPYLDSIWSSVEEAREHAEKATTDDWVWIEEIALNKEFLTVEEGFREMVKDPRSVKK